MSLNNFVKRLQDVMRNDAGINGDAQRIEQMVWILFLKVYNAKEEEWELLDDHYVSVIPEKYRWSNWAVDHKDGKALTGKSLLNFVNNELFPALKNLEIDETTPMSKIIVKSAFEDNNNYMKDGILLRQVVNIIDELDFGEYDDRHAFGDIYETILRSLQSAGNAGEFYTPRAVTDFMTQMVAPKIGEKIADFACGTGGFLTSTLKVLDAQVSTVEEKEIFNNSVYGTEKKALPHLLCVTNMLLHDIDNPIIIHGNALERNVRDYKEDDRFDVVLMNPPYGGSEKEGIKINFPADLQSSETADLFLTVIMYRLKRNGRAAVIIPDGFLFGTDNAKVAIKKKLIEEFNLHTVVRMPHSVFSPYTSITTNILFFDRTAPTSDVWFYRLDMPAGYKHFNKTNPMKLEHFAPAIEWWNNREEITIDGFDKAKRYTVQEFSDRNYNIDLCGFPHEEEEILPPHDLINQYQEKRASLNADIDRILAEVESAFNGEKLHRPISVLSSIEKELASLHASFSSQLKKSILQVAVQGKLVEQDPHDEPASALLKKIRTEKEILIKEGKIKKIKPLPPVVKTDIPFDVPENWEWVRLGDLCEMITKGSSPKWQGINYVENADEGILFITSENVGTEKLLLDNPKYLERRFNEVQARSILRQNDILTNIVGASIGRTCMFNLDYAKCNINQAVAIIRLINHSLCEYVMKYLNSWVAYRIMLGKSVDTARANISLTTLAEFIIPLPPLAEQRRIVAKCDELLAMVEECSDSIGT